MSEVVRYNTVPSQVDAIQFLGDDNSDKVTQWLQDHSVKHQLRTTSYPYYEQLLVELPSKFVVVHIGDWVIRDEQGDYFVADSDLFSRFFTKDDI
jgi:hypothetical protein